MDMPDDCGGRCEVEGEPTCLKHVRAAEGRCTRCGNWPTLCGHDLPFKERMKSIGIDRSSLRS